VIVYRLTTPIDVFDDYVPLTTWLRNAPSPASTAWMLRAVLALQDAAPAVGWEGDMQHLPSVHTPAGSADDTTYLTVKQNNNGDTFVISDTRLDWAEADSDLHYEVPDHNIAPLTHTTTEDIAEAMTEPPWPDTHPADRDPYPF
jgi:hypothetical protein